MYDIRYMKKKKHKKIEKNVVNKLIKNNENRIQKEIFSVKEEKKCKRYFY